MRDPSWLDRTAWPWAPRFHALRGDSPGDSGRHDAPACLHYIDEGNAALPLVVLVHGTPTWGFEWRHVVAGFSGRFRVVVPDHLGFGLSDRPRHADYSPEAHAARFASFMDAVSDTRPLSLVVHDFGGPIALDWALRCPERLRSLTIVNSWMWSLEDDITMRSRARLASGWLGRMLYRHANASLRLIMPSAYGDRARLTRDVHAQYLAVFPDADSRELVLFALVRALLGSSAFYASLWERRHALAQTPTSILWGLRDSAFQPPMLARWRETLPHAAVTTFYAAGHWPHEESPAAFTAALATVLGTALEQS